MNPHINLDEDAADRVLKYVKNRQMIRTANNCVHRVGAQCP